MKDVANRALGKAGVRIDFVASAVIQKMTGVCDDCARLARHALWFIRGNSASVTPRRRKLVPNHALGSAACDFCLEVQISMAYQIARSSLPGLALLSHRQDRLGQIHLPSLTGSVNSERPVPAMGAMWYMYCDCYCTSCMLLAGKGVSYGSVSKTLSAGMSLAVYRVPAPRYAKHTPASK